MDGALVPVVVPRVTVADLAAYLESLGLVGATIEGTALGLADVVVARLVAHDGLLLTVDAADTAGTCAETVLHDRLVERWPDAAVGGEAEEAYELCWPGMIVGSVRTVAVTSPADLMLSVFAKQAEVTLHEARVGDRVMVGMVDDRELPADLLVDALVNARGRSVVLWHTGRHTALHVLKRGKHAATHMWEPQWQPLGPAELDEVRDPGIAGDAARIGALLGLSPADVVTLRAMMRRPSADLAALADLLGLPAEAVDVLEGRTSVAELPGGTATQPGSWGQEIAAAFTSSEHDPALFRFIDRGSRELRPWYLFSSALTIVFGGALIVAWTNGASPFWGVVGLVASLGVVIDLPVRWWRKRSTID